MPANQDTPPSKAAMADAVELLLKRLRREFTSPLHAPSLPTIEPEAWAMAHRKDVLTSIASKAANPTSPFLGARLFPSNAELSALDDAVEKLAKAIGVVRSRYQGRLSTYRRLEHDYARLKLVGFARELAKRVASVPEPPLTKLAKILAGKLSDDVRETVSDLYVSLGGHPLELGGNFRALKAIAKLDWDGFKPWLMRLTSASFNKGLPPQGALMPACYAQLSFRDVLCQQQLWQACYGANLDPTAQWLHGLLDPEIDAQLRVSLHGLALKPDAMHHGFRKLGTLARSRAYRQRRKSGAISSQKS